MHTAVYCVMPDSTDKRFPDEVLYRIMSFADIQTRARMKSSFKQFKNVAEGAGFRAVEDSRATRILLADAAVPINIPVPDLKIVPSKSLVEQAAYALQVLDKYLLHLSRQAAIATPSIPRSLDNRRRTLQDDKEQQRFYRWLRRDFNCYIEQNNVFSRLEYVDVHEDPTLRSCFGFKVSAAVPDSEYLFEVHVALDIAHHAISQFHPHKVVMRDMVFTPPGKSWWFSGELDGAHPLGRFNEQCLASKYLLQYDSDIIGVEAIQRGIKLALLFHAAWFTSIPLPNRRVFIEADVRFIETFLQSTGKFRPLHSQS